MLPRMSARRERSSCLTAGRLPSVRSSDRAEDEDEANVALLAGRYSMKRAVIAIVFVAATAFAVAAAQTGQAGGGAARSTTSTTSTPGGPVPRTADGHPDLSGVWWPGNDLQVRPLAPSPAPAPAPAAPAAAPRQPRPSFASLYQPWAMEKARTLSDKDDPSLHCITAAFGTLNVSLYGMGVVGQIVQTPKFVIMLTETYHGFRLVPTDGRKHRD